MSHWIEKFKLRLRDMPLRDKLTFTVQLTGFGTILFVGMVLFAYQTYQLRQQFRLEIGTLTRMVANYSVAPVTFQDRRGMEEVLAPLGARAEVQFAELRDTDGNTLAHIGSRSPVPSPITNRTGANYDGWWLICREPLQPHDDQSPIGELVLGATFKTLFWDALSNFMPALLLVAVVCLAGMVIMTRFSVRIVLGGLNRLTQSAEQIASTSDYTVRATVWGHDEVGALTQTFNDMLDKLQSNDSEMRASNRSLANEINERKRLEHALVDSSRLAGMAEVATSVLHNVGNVLNSINISTMTLRDRLESSKLKGLQRSTELMAPYLEDPGPFFTNDSRGKLLPKFITEISHQLTLERKALITEVESLIGNVEHIKEIVTTQQSYSRTAGVSEKIDPLDLIEDAIRINQPSMDRHSVTLHCDAPTGIVLHGDRHKLLQILVNLVSNAVHAVKQGDPELRRIDIQMHEAGRDLVIIVRDFGVGIEPQNLTRIFQHGFTTRRDGHGFGLHSGAIAARELGGKLKVESEGLGHGACFTLTVPLEPVPQAVSVETNHPFFQS